MFPTRTAWAVVLVTLTLAATNSVRAADEEAVKALARDLKSKDTQTKLKAAEELGKLGPKAADVAKELCDATLDPNAEVAQAALFALATVRPDLFKPLRTLLRDRVERNRVGAAKDLGELGSDAEPATYLIVKTLTSSVTKDVKGRKAVEPVDDQLFAALLKIGPEDSESIKLLKEIAGPGTALVPYRLRALEVLMDWAVGDEDRQKEMLPLLKAGLETMGMEAVCCAHAARYGALAKDLLPVIKPLQFGRTADVRDAAGKATAAIEGGLKKP